MDAVQLITQVQRMKLQMKQWEGKVDQYRTGQKLLEKQRFQFPQNWLYIDNIEGEWSAFQDIHKRKDTAIQSQIASLQLRIVSEDKVVEEKTSNLLGDWDRGKPVAPSLKPRVGTVEEYFFNSTEFLTYLTRRCDTTIASFYS